jgi:hypothetical protein
MPWGAVYPPGIDVFPSVKPLEAEVSLQLVRDSGSLASSVPEGGWGGTARRPCGKQVVAGDRC